ncbi:MAG: hypothetical protein QF903_04080 [Planctomycetota bacterium]|jgi:lipopolysaccharide export LptBFGC system permease protein LptF|nr:hypothetical protein [Planctomycetota bacterium]MDP6762902.1 hypothetical protein [Planctomycetota bacterium]MDP6988636.1 hypothetical protein [Planctomycetota bacterium]
MPALAQYLLRNASGTTLAVLAALGPLLFLILLSGDAGQAGALLALRPWLAMKVAVVLAAPLLFPLAAAGGVALLHARMHETGETAALVLGARSPAWALRWTLLPAVLLSLASGALLVEAHPAAARAVRSTDWMSAELVGSLLEECAGSQDLEHIAFGGRPHGDGRIEDFALAVEDTREGFAAFAAAEASFALEEDGDLLIELTDGVTAGRGLAGDSLRFGHARIRAWLPALARAGRGSWLKADSRPLLRLASDARQARAIVGPTARTAANRYRVEPFYRLLLAALPALAALQVSLCLYNLPIGADRALPGLVAFLVVCSLSAWMAAGARSFAGDAPSLSVALLAATAVGPGVVAWLVLSVTAWRS